MYKLIKHRGIHNKSVKENTYEAIKMALDSKDYVGVEFDVRETKDHEFIIYHDTLYNGKFISDYYYNELPKFMPKLKDILKINSEKIFLIEIKNIKSVDRFINLLQKNSNKKIYVMSFSNSIIKKINVPKKTYKVGILNYVLNTSEEVKELDFVAILNSLINTAVLNTLKDLEVFSYGLFDKLKYQSVYYIVDK